MKTYKIKSLIYLGVFIAAAFVYYQVEQDAEFKNSLFTSQTADLDVEPSKLDDSEKELEDDLK